MSTALILLGPPGAGKGTQAIRLSAATGLPQVSSGNLLRDNRREGTELGRKAQGYMDAGQLVPDDVVLGMVFERIGEADCEAGFLLDGFPRTVPQAEALDRHLGTRVEQAAINIEVSEDVLVERAAGRLVCAMCGNTHHTSFAPPAEAGKCDRCKNPLQVREDDRPEVIRKRLQVYREQTQPLVAYYQEKGVLDSVDGTGSPDEVFERLRSRVPRRV